MYNFRFIETIESYSSYPYDDVPQVHGRGATNIGNTMTQNYPEQHRLWPEPYRTSKVPSYDSEGYPHGRSDVRDKTTGPYQGTRHHMEEGTMVGHNYHGLDHKPSHSTRHTDIRGQKEQDQRRGQLDAYQGAFPQGATHQPREGPTGPGRKAATSNSDQWRTSSQEIGKHVKRY